MRALVVALVACCLPAVTGCSSPPTDASAATTRAATPESASVRTPAPGTTYVAPTTAPAPLPVATVDKTQAGIFILVWVETLNYGYAQNDADPLRKSISLGCFTCANWVIDVQTHKNDGVTQTGGAVHVRQLVYLGPANADFRFRALLDRDPGVSTGKDGTTTPVIGSTGQVVDLQVGVSTSGLTGKKSWTIKSITAPAAASPSPSR